MSKPIRIDDKLDRLVAYCDYEYRYRVFSADYEEALKEEYLNGRPKSD